MYFLKKYIFVLLKKK